MILCVDLTFKLVVHYVFLQLDAKCRNVVVVVQNHAIKLDTDVKLECWV